MTENYTNGDIVIDFNNAVMFKDYQDKIEDRPCFYVIGLFEKSDKIQVIKIGKASNAVSRLNGYKRLYNYDFKILQLRYFRRFYKTYFHESGAPLTSDWSSYFETDVKRRLRANPKVVCKYPESSEYFDYQYLPYVKREIKNVEADNFEKKIEQVEARRSERLKEKENGKPWFEKGELTNKYEYTPKVEDNPVPVRVSKRINKGKPPVKYSYTKF